MWQDYDALHEYSGWNSVDTECGSATHSVAPTCGRMMFEQVLERIARAYPRALFYPLKITKASLSSAEKGAVDGAGDDGVGDDARFSKLTALTFDASAEAFAEVRTHRN